MVVFSSTGCQYPSEFQYPGEIRDRPYRTPAAGATAVKIHTGSRDPDKQPRPAPFIHEERNFELPPEIAPWERRRNTVLHSNCVINIFIFNTPHHTRAAHPFGINQATGRKSSCTRRLIPLIGLAAPADRIHLGQATAETKGSGKPQVGGNLHIPPASNGFTGWRVEIGSNCKWWLVECSFCLFSLCDCVAGGCIARNFVTAGYGSLVSIDCFFYYYRVSGISHLIPVKPMILA